MIDATKKFWANIFNFSGRATRADFWWAILGNIVLMFIVSIVLGIVLKGQDNAVTLITKIITVLYNIATLSIAVRRLHDINKSGFFWLIEMIPLVGWIFALVWDLTPTKNEGNRWA
ncbi:MAG: DUF805 domain-containing protein [Lactobacillaceae bacterium]|jgi:uncharacterized membrane protein YhaH (DUF805 family)|nr:DUF805 domain-containing protein [Lactobacillaceae bacterium]